ncbi:MFS transporter [Streptomyces sedi]|uniref:MFS transporter n=1 Tax=Streptomyces sedi TaxID=555059 RepID=A0A5C4UYX5_9ACTN|nr:MFS transporter [Streptomyces sedi]TNM28738.1 MFS transporter [Streptomyces sedi]
MGSHTPAENAGQDATRTTRRQWSAVAVLSSSTFVVVTSEMLPVGVLTPMAEGLGTGTGAAGLSLTITGLVTAVTAPAVPRLLGRLDRRVVLAVAMVVLAVGNALTAVAGGFGALVASRVVLGLGMGAVWGLASAIAVRLVAARDAALAVSFAVGGVAAASVVGVPLGTLVGNAFGWRAAFASLAGAALLLAGALLAALPGLPRPASPAEAGAREAPAPLWRHPAVAVGLVLIALLVTAHFAAYTYVRPVLEEETGLSPTPIALVLMVYGVFGLVGNFVAGAWAARGARAALLTLTAGIAFSVGLLALFGTVTAVTGIAVALWGLAYGGLSVAGQIWMTRAAPARTEQVTGVYVGVFTAAIALGAFLGGLVVEAASLTFLLGGAAALAAVALAVGLLGPGPRARSGGAVATPDEESLISRS